MARLIKDGSVQLHRANTESPNKAFARTLAISAKELVQVIAKVTINSPFAIVLLNMLLSELK